MDEALLAAYRATAYRVRLPGGGRATIRIDLPLPDPLPDWVGDLHWGFITAWNPRSQQRARPDNRCAQRKLLGAVQEHAATIAVHAAIGVGGDGWKEPSLFVIGPDPDLLDRLAQRFGQNAYVHGQGHAAAQLRLIALPDGP
ncbi:DUF3293 domain-containing protein [Dyella halodurans]|uniref:DUF3293 domain-containing protein n=1 Tax=Dyella halodurans TaxID=1920171 RepID=A0ABV9C0F6_9GAMM|nr:DUF3293 domain-containing protein [Dyella halodurans]